MKRAASLLLLVSALTVLGCASSQESGIVGTWACKTTGDKMELSKDHSCTVDSMGFHYPGTWTVSKSEVKIEAGQIVLKGSYDGKNIRVEEAIMHGKYTFERIVGTKS